MAFTGQSEMETSVVPGAKEEGAWDLGLFSPQRGFP